MCGFEPRPGHVSTWAYVLARADRVCVEWANAHGMRTVILASVARGSVFRRSGGWCFRLDAGVHAASGHRRQISRQGFATKRDAVVALNNALSELNATQPA